MVPTMLYFKGAPHPRWWRFKDGDAYLDAPIDPEPNALSTILPEFFYTNLDNWFILPLPITAGSLREVQSVQVVDSFGIATEMSPAHHNDQGKSDWQVFTLDSGDDSMDGRFLLVPHVAGELLDNDTIEDIRFVRDDDANLVWALEQTYTEPDGTLVKNGDKARIVAQSAPVNVPNGFAGTFRLSSQTPAHWIPYLPRFVDVGDRAPDGEIYLRRGRTIEAATPDKPQFNSRIVGETTLLNEEEIASVGILVRRINRYTRGTDGRACHWVARCRDVTDRITNSARLKFDYIEKG